MRLTASQREAIRRIVKRSVPDVTFIGLFGSRLDDHRRGGDMGLYLERPGGLSLEAQARLLGEKELPVLEEIAERLIEYCRSETGC